MNGRNFACTDCKCYIDAGYRWAYWLLEYPGIVHLGERVSVEAILSATSYWQPSPEERNTLLTGHVLPAVRAFLTEHAGHTLFYLEDDHLFREDSLYVGYTEVDGGHRA